MWKRRASWNDGSFSSEDIPAHKLERFQSVVTKIMKTVKDRNQEILEVRQDSYNTDTITPSTDMDIDNFEDMIRMAHDAEMKRRERQSKFFVEQTTKIKMPPKKEDPKKMMKEVINTIGNFEKDYRQQIDQVDQVQAIVEEEEEPEEYEVIPVKPPAPIHKPATLATKPVGAKIDTGLRPKIPSHQLPEKREETIATQELSSPSLTIILNSNRTSTIVGLAKKPQEEELLTPKKEEIEFIKPMTVDSYTKTIPKESIHVMPLTLNTKTKGKKFQTKANQILAKEKMLPEIAESRKPLAQMPSLEVIDMSENSDGYNKRLLPQKGRKQYLTQENKTETLEFPNNLSTIEVTIEDSSMGKQNAAESISKEEIGTIPDRFWQADNLFKMLDEVPGRIHVDRRLMRTAEDRRYSRVKTQPRTSASGKPTAIKEWEMMEESGSPLEKINEKTLKSMINHKRRISSAWKENVTTSLNSQISTLPFQLRKEYLHNHLNNGKQGEVYHRVQNEQIARKRLQIAHIMAEALKRENRVEEMKDIALEKEIALLEDRVRRSTPSAKVIEEEERRKLLKQYYKDFGVISGKDYWRKAPKRSTIVMKEYIPETTFENILNQRGFFGRKVKRDSSVIYVPAANCLNIEKPQSSKQELQKTNVPVQNKTKQKESKWKILKRRLSEVVNIMKKEKNKIDTQLVSAKDIDESKDEVLQTLNEMKPVLYDPFKYRVAEERGKIRDPGSLIEVTENEVKELQNINEAKEPRKEPGDVGKTETKTAKEPVKEPGVETLVLTIPPKRSAHTHEHRFSNKTNKGFMKEFTHIYDVLKP